jgi:hypothetical protein
LGLLRGSPVSLVLLLLGKGFAEAVAKDAVEIANQERYPAA